MEGYSNVDTEWREIMGKDIMIKTLSVGSGDIAELGTVVTCNLKGFLMKEDGGPESSPFESLQDQQFKIGESDAFPGLELTLRHSTVGETFALKCTSRFAFGSAGRPSYTIASSGSAESSISDSDKSSKLTVPAVPANADLYYEVVVLKHRKEGEINKELEEVLASLLPGVSSSSEEYKREFNRQSAIQEISLRKDCGNRWFSYLDFQRAARAYSKGTQISDNYFKSLPSSTATEGVEGEEKEPVSSDDLAVVHVHVACLNNLSACYLGQGENLKAKDMCVKVLEFDPTNVKALLRAAKASLALHDYLECDLCLKRVLEITPGNPTALSELAKLRRAEKEYYARSKEMQKNMVKRLFPGGKDGGGNGSGAVTDSTAAPVVSGGDNAKDSSTEAKVVIEEVKVQTPTSSSEISTKETKATAVKAPGDGDKEAGKKEADATSGATPSVSATATATVTVTAPAAPTYISMYNASSNIVMLLVTSLVVVLISIYVAYFAKYQQ